jgi:hypothetical protein
MEKKIKLKEYSLISNEWIDYALNFYTTNKPCCSDEDYSQRAKVAILTELKEQLIPSVKLASAAYDAGVMDEELKQTFDFPKGRFINSKIDLGS